MKISNYFMIIALFGMTLQVVDMESDSWSSQDWNGSIQGDAYIDASLSQGGSGATSDQNEWNSSWSVGGAEGSASQTMTAGTTTTTDLSYATGMTTSTDMSQVTGTATTVGQTEVLYSKPVITQTQELYSKPVVTRKVVSQPIITQKIVQQPIIKQRVVQTPIVRKKVVQRPVYTETENLQPIVDSKTTTKTVPINVPGKTTVREKYIQPTILTKDVQLQVNRGETQINDMPVQTRPVQYTEEVVNRVVQAPAKEVYTQPIYQKTIVNNKETVEFQQSQPQYETKQPIYRQPVLQERTRTQTVTRPGKEIYNNTYIQPIVQRENVDVQFNREADKQVQLDDVVAPAQYKTNSRVETVQVPGNQVITQPVVQKFVEQRDIHHVQQPSVVRVPVHRPYPVPTPVVKKVPVIRKIPVPVRDNKKQGTKIINLSKVTLNGLGGCGSNSSCSKQSKSYSHSHSHSHSEEEMRKGKYYKGEGRGYLGRFHETNFDFGKQHKKMMQKPEMKKESYHPRRTLTAEEINALRKRNQDAAGFDLYGPNGYYTNYVRPEPRREYYNVNRPCVGCEGLYKPERRAASLSRGARIIPLGNFNTNAQLFAPTGSRTTFDGLVDNNNDEDSGSFIVA